MSIRVMSAVFESARLGPVERLVMLALADHADDAGRCYPSNARLQARTGLSERAVRQNIRKLTEAGFLEVQIGVGQAGVNVYIVRPEGGQEMPPAGNAPGTPCPTPRHMVPDRGAPDAPKPSRTIKEPSESKNASRGTRLDADWFLPMDWGVWAKSEGLTVEQIRVEADKFKDYWTGKAGANARKADWQATWRNWIRNFKARGMTNGHAARPSERAAFSQALNAALDAAPVGASLIDRDSRNPFRQ